MLKALSLQRFKIAVPTYAILHIILVQTSWRGKEFNYFCPPHSSNDICLLFCINPSMPSIVRGFIQKRCQWSSLLFGGQHWFIVKSPWRKTLHKKIKNNFFRNHCITSFVTFSYIMLYYREQWEWMVPRNKSKQASIRTRAGRWRQFSRKALTHLWSATLFRSFVLLYA